MICAAVALYRNIFVLVVQLFQRVPALEALAPAQKKPPFLIAQLTVLLLFGVVAVLATIRFCGEPAHAAPQEKTWICDPFTA